MAPDVPGPARIARGAVAVARIAGRATHAGQLAWVHDWVSNPALMPVFESLPVAIFVVNGAVPPHDSALTSVGAELRFANHVSLLAKFDGQFGSNSQTYAGTGTIRYTW